MEKQTASNELILRLLEADKLMEELSEKMYNLNTGEKTDWSHVGDAGRIVEGLKDLLGKNG